MTQVYYFCDDLFIGFLFSLGDVHTCTRAVPGTCFLCPRCPADSDRDETDRERDCIGRLREEGSAACVETSAYALLALREARDSQFTVCLAQWLLKIRSGSGGFYSSQVCKYILTGF